MPSEFHKTIYANAPSAKVSCGLPCFFIHFAYESILRSFNNVLTQNSRSVEGESSQRNKGSLTDLIDHSSSQQKSHHDHRRSDHGHR